MSLDIHPSQLFAELQTFISYVTLDRKICVLTTDAGAAAASCSLLVVHFFFQHTLSSLNTLDL